MKVLVTGASGFVGSHAARALLDAGHEVRASARSAARIRRALEPLGCAAAVEVAEADITDEAAVRAALSGCDAVVHAAAVYSHDARRRREALAVNPRGTEVVLGNASALGLDPVIHVSSYVALLPSAGELTPDSPVGRPPTPYARSKAAAEEAARALQADGAPVTIIYPGMVWGPDDPADGESTLLARDLLAGRIPLGSPGAVPVTDVRDLAAAIAAAVVPGRGPRRYLVAGEELPLAEVMRTVALAGGRRPPRGIMPAPLMLAAGRACDALQPLVRRRLPLGRQGPWTALHARPLDTTATREDLGVRFRPAAATLADTVRWLEGARPPAAAEVAA